MKSEDLILIEGFCLYHNIEETFISALQYHGLIDIIVMQEKEYFAIEQLSSIEKIIRLHFDLEINLENIDIIMNLLNRIDNLQSQLVRDRNKLNFFEKQYGN